MEFMHFPPELQEEVLKHVDGCTLIQAQRVCKLWHKIVSRLQNSTHLWRNCCLKEISHTVLLDLTGLTKGKGWMQGTPGPFKTDNGPASSGEGDCEKEEHYWRHLYAVWHRSRYVGIWSRVEVELVLQPRPFPVNCTKLVGDHVLVGHENGIISLYESLTGSHLGTVGSHLGVFGIQIYPKELQTTYPNFSVVTCGKDPAIRIFDMKSITEGNRKVQVLHRHSCWVNYMSLWGSLLVCAADDHPLHGNSVWDLKSGGLKYCLYGHLNKVKCVAISGDNVVSGSDDGDVLLWKLTEQHMHNIEQFQLLRNFDSWVMDIVLQGALLITITGDGMLHISEDLEHFADYDVQEMIGFKPEKLALKGTLFALGLRGGVVYIYHLTPDTPLNGYRLLAPNDIIKVEDDFINTIDISDDGDGPIVAVATTLAVKTVRWFPTPRLL